jgi:hypothetical protein
LYRIPGVDKGQQKLTMHNEDDKAPFFGKWRGWYISVIVFLALLIVLFSLFTKYFE